MITRTSQDKPPTGGARPCGCQNGGSTTSRERPCPPCNIQAFCRNNFFTGKLLTERDFTTEQRYFRDKLRLHERALHGWGVVCGLKVVPHPNCPELRVVVEAGLAIDECGYEIVVPREVEIALPVPAPTQKRPQLPSPPEPQPPYNGKPTYRQQQPYAPEPPGDVVDYQEPRCAYRLCLKYAECETEFMPAPFDECGCGTNDRQKPNRICESFKLEWVPDKPEDEPPDQDVDCLSIYERALKPCREPAGGSCIILALLPDYAPGDRLTEADIDNLTYRRVLPSVALHDDLIRCILDRLPGRAVTRVQDIGWTHGEEYRFRDFVRYFTGEGPSSAAFEVTFEGPIMDDGLSPRSFHAVIVRHVHGECGGGPMEMAPARVWGSPDRSKAYLQIDRSFVERHLEGARFDVYLTLKCDVLLDERGVPIDGNLQARLEDGSYVVSLPSGDGIPGGSLESWIRVGG